MFFIKASIRGTGPLVYLDKSIFFSLPNNIFAGYLHLLSYIYRNFATSYQYKPMERKLLNRIKVVLAEKNMTNKQLAELLGKDPAVVSKWVTNTNQPNLETVIQIAKVLEVSVDELLRTE